MTRRTERIVHRRGQGDAGKIVICRDRAGFFNFSSHSAAGGPP